MTRLAPLPVVLAAALVPSDGLGPTTPVPGDGPGLPVVDGVPYATPGANTYAGGGAGSAIMDVSTTIVHVHVAESATIGDVNVALSLGHTYVSDLTIRLTSPVGTEVLLSSRNGGSGEDYSGTIFDDEADMSITTGTAPFTGSYRPEGSLSDFINEDQMGTWTLTIVDGMWGDQGTLTSWALHIESDLAPTGGGADPPEGTLVIGDIDTGVADDGAFADAVAECQTGAENHGEFVSCVTQRANEWMKDGKISGQQKGAITSAAARATGS